MTRAILPTRAASDPPKKMRRPRRRRIVAAICAGAVASFFFLTAAPATAAPASSPVAGLDYVALGDSYSAGYGLEPYSKTTPADGCYQADENYPHRVAAALGLHLTDRTCSNAVTANIINTPQDTGSGTAPVQSDYLNADTDIVTVTIGGNDLWFAFVAATCIALKSDGPMLLEPWQDNCRSLYEYKAGETTIDILKGWLDSVVKGRLAKTYQTIEQKAPNAKLFVIGYPAIAPDAANTPPGGCFTTLGTDNAYPFTPTDVPYLHEIQQDLNEAIQQEAEAAGATFIPTFAQTESRTPCAGNVNSYINGITIDFSGDKYHGPTIPDTAPYVVDGHFTEKTIPKFQKDLAAIGAPPGVGVGDIPGVKLGALHPNEAGVAFLKEQVIAAITAAFPASGQTGTTGNAEPASSGKTLAATGSNAAGWLGLAGLLLAAGIMLVARRRRNALR